MNTPPIKLAALGMVALSGCAYQSDTHYLGEPLGVVHGEVANPDGSFIETDIVLLWDSPGGWQADSHHSIDGLILQTLGHSVETDFPASFSLRLYVPPDEAARSAWSLGANGPGLSIGRIAAVPAGAWADGACLNCAETVGMVSQHVIVFVDVDRSGGTPTTDWFQAADLEPGYHLMEVVPAQSSGCSSTSDCLRPAPAEMETEVLLEMGAEVGAPTWG